MKPNIEDDDFEDSFWDDDDFDGNREPDCYSCSVCNHTQERPGMGNGCDNCGMFNVMQEEYF